MNGECEMRKRMRKPLAFLLTLLMLVSVMGSSALAEDTSPTGTAAAQEDETLSLIHISGKCQDTQRDAQFRKQKGKL